MRRGIVTLLAALLLIGGCTAQKKLPPDTQSPPPSQDEEKGGELTVSTDWSKLDDNKPLPSVGSRWYDEYTGHLILRDDYGPLIPYAGLRLMDDWPARNGCLYGLMTKDGVVVTDAVYSSVTRPTYYFGAQISHPLLALLMMAPPDDVHVYGKDSWAIAANDGSWITEFCYRGMRVRKDGLLLFEDERIAFMSPTGEIINVWTMEQLGLTQEEIKSIHFSLAWGEGWFGEWYGDYFCLGVTDDTCEEVYLINLSMGRKETMTASAWEALIQALIERRPDIEEVPPNLPPGDYGNIAYLWDDFSDDDTPGLVSVMRNEADGARELFFLYDGTPIPELIRKKPGRWYYSIQPVGGLIEVVDLNTTSYYEPRTMDCVFRTYLGYYAD